MSGPKEGIYLDAALAVVEQQVDERIDRIVDRRRRMTRLTIGVLLSTTLAGGALTAAALTYFPQEVLPAAEPLVAVELHCVEGGDATAPAYFTARFRVTEAGASRTDPADVCSAARSTLTESTELANANPAALLRIATRVVASAEAEPEEGAAAAAPEVSEASFGALQLTGSIELGVCERASDGRLVVLTLPRDDAPASWSAQCREAEGYRLAGSGR